jgi:dienelactone hydrolase
MATTSLTVFPQKFPTQLKEEIVTYYSGGSSFSGFVAYDEGVKGKRPVVLVVPEWWGLNDYVKMRTRKLAELGYLAMAVDMFGDGKTAANPKEAQEFTGPFYKDPQMVKERLDPAMKKIREFPLADTTEMAMIGYCFGGYVALNYAKLGADLKGVVSFHGGLGGVPAEKNLLKANLLICQGGSDKFVTIQDADKFKHQMDSISANYTLKVYPNATHAFSNPDATRIGKEFNMPIEYNAEADKNSWNDMIAFFNGIFRK